jgi:hypothetical protein
VNKLYYQTTFDSTAPEAIKRCIKHFKKAVFDRLPGVECWVAGGAVKDFFLKTEPNDIDIYFKNEGDHDLAFSIACSGGMDNHLSHRDNDRTNKVVLKNPFTDRSYKIDLIKLYHNNPIDCISSFDFTCCSAAVTPVSFVCHPDYFVDLASKELKLNGPVRGISILPRIQKYIQKGYYMSPGEMFKLTAALRLLDFNNPEVSRIFFYEEDNKEFLEREDIKSIIDELKFLR